MAQKGILLVNVGTPDEPTEEAVRRFLNEFLMDARVFDAPYVIRRYVVSRHILPTRPQKVAKAYQQIWTDQGSPLIVTGQRICVALQERLGWPVALGMRYGNPSIRDSIGELMEQAESELSEILLIPLFPHFAMSSYQTAVLAVEKEVARYHGRITLRTVPPFFEDPLYIRCLVESAKDYLGQAYDFLLFSYHGIPVRHLKKSDPTRKHCMATKDCCFTPSPSHATCYRAQVFRTTKCFVEAAGIPEGKYSVSFQSRLGKDSWLEPYTDAEVHRLAKAGVKKLLVVCPAFVADCLETVEEIGTEAKDNFIAAGGEELQLIPCLNDHPQWIETLQRWCLAKR